MSPVQNPEAQLCERALAGERAAFETLVRSHQAAVRSQLRRLTKGDLALADDLAQESFIQVWIHLSEFRVEARFATWLYRIAYNRFLAHLRSHPATEPLPDESVSGKVGESASRDEAAQARRLDVAAALKRLPEAEQIALIHCYYLDLSHDEAAQVLNLPLGTLKSQILRAKVRLRELLSAWKPEMSS